VRALHPHVGARVALSDGTLLGVHRARVAAERGPAGTLTAAEGRLLYGACDRTLELLEVQPPGGRPMDAAAYLRGHGLPGRR
jgi:methionyl-tRNA formyltransferase